ETGAPQSPSLIPGSSQARTTVEPAARNCQVVQHRTVAAAPRAAARGRTALRSLLGGRSGDGSDRGRPHRAGDGRAQLLVRRAPVAVRHPPPSEAAGREQGAGVATVMKDAARTPTEVRQRGGRGRSKTFSQAAPR